MSDRLQRFLVSALLAVAVLAVFLPVVHYDFIALDDAQYVKDNENINHGFSLAGIKWVFENQVAGNWHPVTMLSHMADCQIYGPSAGGQHFTNLLLHAANTLLLFWLLLAMTKKRKSATIQKADKKKKSENKQPESPISNLLPCALAAALFGLHPLHVESVAWIAERKDVLSAFFGLLTLLCYSRYVEKSRTSASWIFYILALAMFALGLMSKPMLVTLPFVMLLLDFWPLQRIAISKSLVPVFGRRLIVEKIPFLLLAVIFSFIAFHVQKEAGAVVALKNFPLDARLANAMVAYTHYLEKTFWPASLAMLYPYRHWTQGEIAGSTVLFVGLSLVAILTARNKPYIFVGWFWFVGMLVPVIGIVQVGLQAMADHYTYLPLIGIFIIVAWGLEDVAALPTAAQPRVSNLHGIMPLRRAAVISGVALALVLASAASAVQVRYWKNSETLFEHAARVTGDNTVAHYILGALFDSQGKTDRALSEFTQAIQDDPGNVKARCGLGYILCAGDKLDEAEEQYRDALQIAPDLAKAHFGLAEVMMKQHDFDDAMSEYFLALQSDPNIPEAHYQLAGLYSAKGDAASAISQLEQAVQLAPDWPLALNNLAWILATQPESKLRNGPEAIRLATRAVTLTGKGNPYMLDTLAAAYAAAGQFKDAAQTAETACQAASAADQTNLASKIQSRLKLYQSQQAYRE